MKEVVIETLFRCRIDYDVGAVDTTDPLPYERISNKAYEWARIEDVDASDSHGGPAWNAYFIFEGESEAKVRNVAEKVVRYIRRFKHAKIYE